MKGTIESSLISSDDPYVNDLNLSKAENNSDEGENSIRYQVRKWGGLAVGCICYLIAYFHRFAPAVLSRMMAPDFGVSVPDLGFFSAIFFWPFGLMQPVIGSLVDTFEPGYVIGICMIIASIGAVVMGVAKTLSLCSLGRFVVGVGCSSVYVSLNKIASNWCSQKEYRVFAGAAIGIGGIGSVISQVPLEFMGSLVGWRICFHFVALISAVFGIISILVIRGHPSSLNFVSRSPLPTKPSFSQIAKSWAFVLSLREFWLLAVQMFFAPGIFVVVSGLWGVPYLSDVLGYSNADASKIQMCLSLSLIIGCPSLPIIAEKVKSRKHTLLAFTIISFLSSLTMTIFNKFNTLSISLLFFFFGVGSCSAQGVLIGFFKELNSRKIEGTLLGFGNACPFIGGAILQTISSNIIGTYERRMTGSLPTESYTFGLWMCATIALFVSCVVNCIIRNESTYTRNHSVSI